MFGDNRVRAVLTILALSLASCTTQKTFLGPPEFQLWMQRALAQPGNNPAYRRFAMAYRGKPEGLHAYFVEALRQAESPEINVEAGEGLSWELQTIIQRIGDARFAASLVSEPPRVRSAVASCFGEVASPAYPQTKWLLDATPKINFPMLKTYRGDYHPAASNA